MNITAYKIARFLQFIPLDCLMKLTRQNHLLPFYHLVSDSEVLHVKHLYKVKSTKEFNKDLDFYLKHYTPIDFTGIGNQRHKTFLLTFDDGLAEFYDVIAPILLKKGIPAVCFLNSDFIDNKDLFYRYKASVLIEELNNKRNQTNLRKEIDNWFLNHNLHNNSSSLLSLSYLQRNYLDELASLIGVDFSLYLKEKKPYLTSEQIQKLIRQGFHFGAHSIDHPQYVELDQETQIRQTVESINTVQTRFSLPYKLFSFPFTDSGVSANFFRQIYDNNVHAADFTFGCSGLKKDMFDSHLQRIPMEIEDFSASDIIYGEYFYYILKSIFNKNKITRK
jgi:peptidoglycan/xylan/chitin deacetylase (PgdA/CDA1 family)